GNLSSADCRDDKPKDPVPGLIAFTADSALGRGLFVADPVTGKWTKVLGMTGDVLDSNETWVDLNHDGQFQPGEDISTVTGVDLDKHLGITLIPSLFGGGSSFEISFFGTTNTTAGSKHGLYTYKFEFDD